MMNRVCRVASVFVVAVLSGTARGADSPVRGADAPDFPAFHDGGPLLGATAPLGGGLPLHLRWTFRADSDPPPGQGGAQVTITPGFEASAAIVGDRVYAAERSGGLRALDLKTGKRLWTYRSEAGFAASPAVAGGRVILGDEDGIVHAVSAETGAKLWTFDAGSGIHSSANFLGDRVVFGDDGADVYCLNAADGRKIWDAKAGDRVNSAPSIGAAAPGKSPGVFVSGCDAELREFDLTDGRQRFEQEIGALCPGSPALLADRIVVGTDGGKVLCLSRDGKKRIWTFDGVADQAMVYSSPAVADGIVAVGARDRNVYGLDLATGKMKWRFATRGDVDSSPEISGGRVYIGSKDRRFYVLDLKTGRRLQEFVASRGITGSPAIAHGVVVIGDSGGDLYCFEPAR